MNPPCARWIAIGLATACLFGCASTNPPASAAPQALEECGIPPRCVVSREDAAERRVDPLRYSGSEADARAMLATIVESIEGCRVHATVRGYLHGICTTARMRYRDDVEFLLHADGRIDVRSSSRIGWYDFEVNRERIESVRSRWDALH